MMNNASTFSLKKRGKTLILGLLATALTPSLATADEQNATTNEGRQSEDTSALSQNDFVRTLQIGLNVVTSYHAVSLPHEGVHGLVGAAFGMPPTDLNFSLMVESISFDKNDERKASAFGRSARSMSAPIFTRLTLDAPRWIVSPTPGSYWDAWTGAFWTIGFMTPWVTTIGSWSAWSEQSESGWDFYNTAVALGGANKGKQAAVLGVLSSLMVADLWWNFDQVRENFAIMGGRVPESRRAATRHERGRWHWHVAGLGLSASRTF